MLVWGWEIFSAAVDYRYYDSLENRKQDWSEQDGRTQSVWTREGGGGGRPEEDLKDLEENDIYCNQTETTLPNDELLCVTINKYGV